MPISVRFSAETEKRLAALSARTGQTKAFLVRQIVENGIEDVEDGYFAAEVMERLRRGEEEIITHEEFWRDLNHGR